MTDLFSLLLTAGAEKSVLRLVVKLKPVNADGLT
jgi:hypothetical protein